MDYIDYLIAAKIARMNGGSSGGGGGSGVAPNITTGTISTLPAGSQATASITGTTPNLTLNLGLPAGAAGVTPNVTIGTVTMLANGATPTASVSGTAPNFAINLGLPAGGSGTPPNLTSGTITTLAAGASATASISGTAPNFSLNLGLPAGAAGPTPTITAGTITQLGSGASPTASLTGTAPNYTLNLGIPAGAAGSTPSIAAGTVTALASGASPTATLTGTAPNYTLNLGIPAGAAGTTPSIAAGTVSTLAAGASATATLTGTAPNYTLNLGIPAGASGDKWSFGTGAPASGFGVVGQNYLATDTKNYYNKADATTWNLVGNFVTVSTNAVTYQAGSSATTAPTGTWVSTPPAVTKGQYLWTRSVTTYSNATTSTEYAVSYQALDGVTPAFTAVATQIAAGSSPTAVVSGTAPNYTLTLGIPTLNSTILRTGIGTQIAFTVSSAAGSNTGSFLIPANTVTNTQAFFQVDAYFTATNDAMTKAVTLSIGGQNIATFSTTTGSRGNGLEQTGMNRGALNSQVWKPLAANGGLGTSAQVGINATTIDWTVDNTFLITVAVSGTVVAGSTATCEYVNLIIFN